MVDRVLHLASLHIHVLVHMQLDELEVQHVQALICAVPVIDDLGLLVADGREATIRLFFINEALLGARCAFEILMVRLTEDDEARSVVVDCATAIEAVHHFIDRRGAWRDAVVRRVQVLVAPECIVRAVDTADSAGGREVSYEVLKTAERLAVVLSVGVEYRSAEVV